MTVPTERGLGEPDRSALIGRATAAGLEPEVIVAALASLEPLMPDVERVVGAVRRRERCDVRLSGAAAPGGRGVDRDGGDRDAERSGDSA
ncbi:hypothetical protein [Kitasatospora sp. GP82]|uniref:hypothetical protein n=1 Tax=Kitasatospora sp. GP82 TaxID=3035089 RepID=UPI0024764B1E|nr:hypothetical protein [Kitasatospora sp. GP82]